MRTRHFATAVILFVPLVLGAVPAGAGEISIEVPGNGTTVVDLPAGQVVLGIVRSPLQVQSHDA